MLEYKAIVVETGFQLNGYVNRAIADGWKPLGGASVAVVWCGTARAYTYVQAMIREIPDKEQATT